MGIDIKNVRSHGTDADVLTLFQPDPDPDPVPHKTLVAQVTTMGIEQTKLENNSLEHDGYSMLLKSSSCFMESSDNAHAAEFADVPSYGEYLHLPQDMMRDAKKVRPYDTNADVIALYQPDPDPIQDCIHDTTLPFYKYVNKCSMDVSDLLGYVAGSFRLV